MTKARVFLNLPASLKAAAEGYAERDGVSLIQFIALALAEKVGAFSAGEFFSQRTRMKAGMNHACANEIRGHHQETGYGLRPTNDGLVAHIC